MLIEFSVGNFRSFRERQTLSMVAAPGLGKENNVFPAPVDGEDLPDLLKVTAIYGPNASGKSNLLRAIATVWRIAGMEPSAKPTELPVSPFRFDAALRNQPSTFEVHFIENQTRYEFTLAVTAERIVDERLVAFPLGKETLLYHRTRSEGRDKYELGDALEGGRPLHETWINATNGQVLFLSRAVANSNEDIQQLRVPYKWLTERSILVFGEDNLTDWKRRTHSLLAKHPAVVSDAIDLLDEADIPVSAIHSRTASSFGEHQQTTLTHRTSLGEAEFDLSEESAGTQNLFAFMLPWSTWHDKSLVFIDEFDSSLHPDIVATLVRKHIESDTPRQLIFTTHDTHLMTTKLLRRDQLWLTERDANGATQLRAIHDFEGSEAEDIEKRYFEGRYRGLPLVRRD